MIQLVRYLTLELNLINDLYNVDIVEDENDPVITQFKSMNLGNGYNIYRIRDNTFKYCTLPDAYMCLYLIDRGNKPISNPQIFNLNMSSGYRVQFDEIGRIIANVFMEKELALYRQYEESEYGERKLVRDFKDMDKATADRFIRNMRAVCNNLILFAYPNMDIKNANVGASVIAVAVVRSLGVPVTPSDLADSYSCSVPLAEAIIDKYSVSEEKFIGLPWML